MIVFGAILVATINLGVIAADGVGKMQQLVTRRIVDLKSYPGNARTHSRKQVRQIASSIERFGFTNPVLVSDDGEIIAGHGRVTAAKLLA